jgi:hypothetical protein
MATVPDTLSSGYADADDFVRYQIDHARQRIKATDLMLAAVVVALLVVGSRCWTTGWWMADLVRGHGPRCWGSC